MTGSEPAGHSSGVLSNEEQKKYYNLCRPEDALDPNDPRYVDLDYAMEGEAPPRGDPWAETLAKELELSDKPLFRLFTGLPGTGKSSALRQLRHKLELQQFHCILIDAKDVLELSVELEIFDLHLMMLWKTEESVLILEGQPPELALSDGYLTRFWEWVSRTEVNLKQFEVSSGAEIATPTAGPAPVAKVSGGAKAVVELKSNPTLRARLREALKTQTSTFLAEVRAEYKQLVARVQARGLRGIVVMLDSLEKLQGTSASFEDVLASAERLFSNGAPYLQLVDPPPQTPPLLHAVLTVPPALTFRANILDLQFLPMLKLHERDETTTAVPTRVPFKSGHRAAREILRKRVPDEAMKRLLGSACEQRLNRMIEWSGGYPRELVRLLQMMVRQSSEITDAVFDRLLAAAGDSYRRVVSREAIPLLIELEKNKRLSFEEAKRSLIDRLLSNNIILRYQNNEEWFDLHPAVRSLPELTAARASAPKPPKS